MVHSSFFAGLIRDRCQTPCRLREALVQALNNIKIHSQNQGYGELRSSSAECRGEFAVRI